MGNAWVGKVQPFTAFERPARPLGCGSTRPACRSQSQGAVRQQLQRAGEPLRVGAM